MSNRAEQAGQYLTAYVDGRYLGLSIRHVQDVIGPHDITRIPRAGAAVAGVLNLRGRIVTAIDMRERFAHGDPATRGDGKAGARQEMGIIVESRDELFSLLVDRVEDVLTLPDSEIKTVPVTLDPVWSSVCSGVCQRDDRILILLDAEKVLAMDEA